MIIDQLPLLSTDVQGTDEIPIERGTSAYKTTQAALVKSVAEDVDRKGLPVGGSAGQILAKVDGTDYNTQWIDPPDPSGFVSYAQAQSLTDAQQTQARDNIGANWDLLWENASPTSDFAAQTISLPLSNYRLVLIIARRKSDSETISEIGGIGDRIFLNYVAQSSSNFFARTRLCTVTSTGIVFAAAYQGTSINNGYNVPAQIYGMR